MAEVIKEWDGYEFVAPPLNGATPVGGAKRGRAVAAGELLAVCDNRFQGDIHAPCSGIITEINEFEIIIQRGDKALGEPPLPRELHSLPPAELAVAVKELGFDLPEIRPGEPLIINTLTEPGLGYNAALFSEHAETMLAGIAAAQHLWPQRKIIWAASKTFSVKNPAPGGVEILVAANKNIPRGAGVLGGRELYFLGRLWRTGLSLTRMVISLGASNYFVPIGSRPADLLRFANLYPKAGEVVVEGGLTRGHSLARLERGLSKTAAALHLVKGLPMTAGKTSGTGLRQLAEGPYIKAPLFSRLLSFLKKNKASAAAPQSGPLTERPGFTLRLKCGHQGQAPLIAEYNGPKSCRAANVHDGGPLLCPYGCLGCGDCTAACPRGAITMRNGFPVINEELCAACGACLNACPKNLFEIVPKGAKAFIPCASKSALKKNASYCPNACLGCGKCRKACPVKAISRPAPNGAMAVNQELCGLHNAVCGQICKSVCPRRIL